MAKMYTIVMLTVPLKGKIVIVMAVRTRSGINKGQGLDVIVAVPGARLGKPCC